MEGKARFIFPVIISALIVFVVSAVVTFTNIGLRADFVPRWLKAFMTGWPVAAVLSFLAIPYVRRATEAIVRMIEKQA
jgi:ABC-type phosphate transport system permease subunit